MKFAINENDREERQNLGYAEQLLHHLEMLVAVLDRWYLAFTKNNF